MKEILQFIVNKKEVSIEVEPGVMLVDILREDLKLIGTKIGCREGECGACTILLDSKPVNSCMIPALKAQGSNILTIEGIGDEIQPHQLQSLFAEEGAIQCGYCTPGFIMSGIALLTKNPNPSDQDIREAISGNLCRCTGYTRIVQAIKRASIYPIYSKEKSEYDT